MAERRKIKDRQTPMAKKSFRLFVHAPIVWSAVLHNIQGSPERLGVKGTLTYVS
jgi:hypothetical protein